MQQLEHEFTLRSDSKTLEQHSVPLSQDIGSFFHRNELLYLKKRFREKKTQLNKFHEFESMLNFCTR